MRNPPTGRCPAGWALYGELDRSQFCAGVELVVQADLDGVRVGLLICYDVEFPEAVRAHALAGTQVLVVPTALMRPYERVADVLVPVRAHENGLYLVYANRCDVEGELVYCGHSTVASPDGTVAIAGAGPELIFADVDPAALTHSGNTYLADRRPELYRSLADPRE